MTRTLTLTLAALMMHAPAFAQKRIDPLDCWAQWRGPLGTGVAPRGKPPIQWSENENIRWKTALPGLGHSTPVVWGDRIFLTTAIPFGEKVGDADAHQHAHGAHNNTAADRKMNFVVMAIDRRDGTILWQKTVLRERPHESTHETGSWASASPVTDGKRVIASFGSRGIFCLDMKGERLWQLDLGDMRTKHGHGEGSSPALHGHVLVVNWDHDDDSFVMAIDSRTGKPLWRTPRNETTSWSSPLIVEVDGKPQVIISATNRVRGYDLVTGRVIWECGGLSGNVVATPVAAGGMVYAANSYETREMLAIRIAGAKGDITGTDAVLWTRHRNTPYVPSPVLIGNALCFLKHYQGILTCVDAKSGEVLLGPERLPGVDNVFASLAGADDRIYITDRDGTTAVIQRGTKLNVLAQNQLDDSFSASPVIVGRDLLLRGERHLYCITNAKGN